MPVEKIKDLAAQKDSLSADTCEADIKSNEKREKRAIANGERSGTSEQREDTHQIKNEESNKNQERKTLKRQHDDLDDEDQNGSEHGPATVGSVKPPGGSGQNSKIPKTSTAEFSHSGRAPGAPIAPFPRGETALIRSMTNMKAHSSIGGPRLGDKMPVNAGASGSFAPWKNGNNVGRRNITAFCTVSGMSRRDFKPGQVINVPLHVTNHDTKRQKATMEQGRESLLQSAVGGVLSKRRFMVVLYLCADEMCALPAYTHGSTGLGNCSEAAIQEYVGLKFENSRTFNNEAMYSPVEQEFKPNVVEKPRYIHFTSGVMISYQEDITILGKLTTRGYKKLAGLYCRATDIEIDAAMRML